MTVSPCPTAPPPVAPSRAELQAHLYALAPELLQDGSRYLTALAYLASLSRPSIDRIAWLLGCDREFVARRARRWADHGVWNSPSQADHQLTGKRLAFLVDVGEGKVPSPCLEADAPFAIARHDRADEVDTVHGDVLLDTLWRGLGLAPPDDWERLIA